MAAVVTAILNFQNGRHWKLKISITLLCMLCIQMCVLMVNCIPNHTKCVDISPDFVLATTENSKLI